MPPARRPWRHPAFGPEPAWPVKKTVTLEQALSGVTMPAMSANNRCAVRARKFDYVLEGGFSHPARETNRMGRMKIAINIQEMKR